MLENLKTYVQDHLAGAVSGLDIAESIEESDQPQERSELGTFLRSAIDEDKKVLESIAEAIGCEESAIKSAVAWVGTKLSAPKISPKMRPPFSCLNASKCCRWEFSASAPSGRHWIR